MENNLEKLRQALARHLTIGLDTAIFIYHFNREERYLPYTREIFKTVEQGTVEGITTIMTLAEILVKPLKENAFEAAEDYRTLLKSFPHLTVLSLDDRCASLAAALRAKHKIKMPDALPLAGALQGAATLFITNDHDLKKIDEMEIFTLN